MRNLLRRKSCVSRLSRWKSNWKEQANLCQDWQGRGIDGRSMYRYVKWLKYYTMYGSTNMMRNLPRRKNCLSKPSRLRSNWKEQANLCQDWQGRGTDGRLMYRYVKWLKRSKNMMKNLPRSKNCVSRPSKWRSNMKEQDNLYQNWPGRGIGRRLIYSKSFYCYRKVVYSIITNAAHSHSKLEWI